jgi:small-conductance mechanosensitive channel
MTFGENANELELRFFVAEINQRNLVRSELMMRIAEAFAANGIEQPNPQRDIWLRNAPQLTEPAPAEQKPAAAPPQRADNADDMKASKRS